MHGPMLGLRFFQALVELSQLTCANLERGQVLGVREIINLLIIQIVFLLCHLTLQGAHH